MKMKNILLLATSIVALASCSSSAKKTAEPAKTKTLVVFYSQTNTTRTVALEIQSKLGADTAEIKVSGEYPTDFQATIQRWQEDMKNGVTPAIEPLKVNLADYDTIFIGYPIWGGTYAHPVASFIKDNDLSGKVVFPFCTFGSGGRVSSTNNLKAALPNAKIGESYGVRQARIASAPAEIDTFLKKIGALAGETEQLPDFSEAQAVNDDDKALFDAATSSYGMYKMTPVTVCSRATSNGTDYIFTAENAGPDGSTSQLTVFVTKGGDENAVPEFTAVER